MNENDIDNKKPEQKEGEHTPFLAPLDEQARSGNMGIYLDVSDDRDAKKKQIFLVIIVCLVLISMIWKLLVFDMDRQEALREERRAQAAEFQKLIESKEKQAIGSTR